MSKNRYRVSIIFSYDMEREQDYATVQQEAEDLLNKLATNLQLTKKQIHVEKIKEIRHRIRLGEFTVDEVIPFLSREERKREYKVGETTYAVRMDSSRYFVFKENLKCSACGLEGSKFCLEQSPSDKNPHFNLYAIEHGNYILMTKDHINPKCTGGVDIHSNFQTMCAICNNLKGSCNIPLDKFKEMRAIYNSSRCLPKKKARQLLQDARTQFKLPHVKSHIPKKDRKSFLSQLKSKENAVVTNVDLRVWRLNTGGLIAKSIYERCEDAVELASVRVGTIFIPITNVNSKVTVNLENGENCDIYQGHLEFLKAEENHVN